MIRNVALFLVYFSAWNSGTLNNIKGHSTIIYDKVFSNEGNAYNEATGKFTAPRDGPFVFTWTALTTDKFLINVYIWHNGKRLSVAQAESKDETQNSSGSNTIVLKLKKDDVVELKCGLWGDDKLHQLYGDAHSTFSGWEL
ncbi:hypothetical protein FSP39_016689 [Pinctada imbricata]|uniref:C1q domain-containing protein n=1 Tax=Pinctada imbricata TaxID=66713 RepID=A0AA89BPG8_PINIB|nr:hypothetical protein FSP39_016689 [Pinctada imbricata]